jgi:hypothetical protein
MKEQEENTCEELYRSSVLKTSLIFRYTLTLSYYVQYLFSAYIISCPLLLPCLCFSQRGKERGKERRKGRIKKFLGGAGAVFSVFRVNSVFKPQSVCGAGCTEKARVIRCSHLVILAKDQPCTSEERGFIYGTG